MLLAYESLLLKAKALDCSYDQNLEKAAPFSLKFMRMCSVELLRHNLCGCHSGPVNILGLSLTNGLEQLFSTGDDVLLFSHRRQLATSGNILGCHNFGGSATGI